MRARGQVFFWQGGSLWIGRGQGRTRRHGHHAHQITLPLAGVCRFRTEESGDWTGFAGAFVRSERPHEFEMEDLEEVAQWFVEPETAEGRALARRFPDADVSPLTEADRAALLGKLLGAYRAGAPDPEMIAASRAAIAALADAPPSMTDLDPRIAGSLDFIGARVHGPITLSDVAASAALSPGRFRHLFVRETGAAFRPYVLWLRLNVAIECAMRGGSWTEAAHEAGFADSAHLSRTFKRMFGMNPATLVLQRSARAPGETPLTPWRADEARS
jgi:AraC family transcriptional regulator